MNGVTVFSGMGVPGSLIQLLNLVNRNVPFNVERDGERWVSLGPYGPRK